MDSEDQSRTLSGASFELYRFATEKEILTDAPGLTEISGVNGKVIRGSFFDNAGLDGEKVTSAISGNDGKVTLYGLSYGRYFLVETKAPNGYNYLEKPPELMINESSHLEENRIIIENSTGMLVPGTGGIGTTIFTVVGLILIIGSGSLLVTKLYMRRK